MYERAFSSVTKYIIFHPCCLCKKISVIVLQVYYLPQLFATLIWQATYSVAIVLL